jgi:hypothetical protein
MKVIALVLAAAAAVASAHPTFSEWSETRHYRTPEERVVRQANYEANVAAIEARTAEGISHTLGVNDFADLTTAEFSSRYLVRCNCQVSVCPASRHPPPPPTPLCLIAGRMEGPLRTREWL